MNTRNIGRIVIINNKNIVAELYDNTENYINTTDGVRFIGEVGSYISIYDIDRTIIGEIIGVEQKPFSNNNEFGKPTYNKTISINLVGEIVSEKFFFGVSKMPLLYADIYIISKKDLEKMLGTSDENVKIIDNSEATRANLLTIGKSVIFQDYDVKVNIDKFFGFHFAVFGNTGSGKSNTIANILQTIFKKTNYSACGAKFIIIDSNGEYSRALSKITSINKEISIKEFNTFESTSEKQLLEIPVWALSADDWAILLHASEKTQIPVLKRAIDIAKIFYSSNDTNNDVRNHILASSLLGICTSSDTSPSKNDKIVSIINKFGTKEINLNIDVNPCQKLVDLCSIEYGKFRNIDGFMEYLKQFIKQDMRDIISIKEDIPYGFDEFYNAVDFATIYEGSISSQRIHEYTSTLVTRLKSLIDGQQGKIFQKTEYKNIDQFIDNFISGNQIINIDISLLDDAAGEVITKVLGKFLLDYLRKSSKKAEMPINFIIEEAHRFIHASNNYGVLGYNIFERIAKEGRKYGLLLGISSQRPSELSKTVVSQCSNFITHRVQNPDDLQYLSKMVPYINAGTIERLTYLQTGHALVFGVAINVPTLTRFEPASPAPDSDNAQISKKWYISKSAPL